MVIGSFTAVAVMIALLALLLPSKKPPNPVAKGNEGPAQLAAAISTKVSKADREAINTTLDAFVPAAVGRKNQRLAWSLAGPGLTSGSTLSEWEHNISPVPVYSAIGGDANYDGWRVLDATKTEVDFSLIVHHRKGTNVGDWIFQGTMLKVNGHWLVNGLYTAAINNPVRGSQHEVGPADFAAAGTGGEPPQAKPPLGSTWLAVLFVAMGLVFVVMATIGIVVFLRGRRARRRAQSSGLSSLPPLPSRSANP
jgi:hypothetical protein